MRFASLGSGSRGNATLVEAGATLVLVDCGFSVREAERRLARLGRCARDLAALLVTHEHTDHVRGVAALARKYALPVWLTRGTWSMLRERDLPDVRFCDGHQAFAIDDLQVAPFTVPHDAREPCQYVFADGARRLGVITDTGRMTPHIRACLDRCDALLLECNHDAALLAAGPYPPSLKQRVGGPLGHLSNDQAAELLASLDTTRLQHVVAAHLSDKNNRPELARAALADGLGCAANWIGVAGQERGLDWRQIG
ncbi:MAG: MBL fold metallo-hydrolase [Pseudomonadota bacterium]